MKDRQIDPRYTRFYKTQENLIKGLERFGFENLGSIHVETPHGWTAIFGAVAAHNQGMQPIWLAQKGFMTI
jgi:hypothetical protein